MNESPRSRDRARAAASPTTTSPSQDIDPTPNIKVCARVRPFIREEYRRCSIAGEGATPELCVQMPSNRHVQIQRLGEEVRKFEFDRSYWSFSEDDPRFVSQAEVYKELGEDLLRHAISGFNNCIFAYGQTASGKSHSVLGGKDEEDRGLVPRIVQGLYQHFQSLPAGTTYKVLVSFLEIYNEQIRDLLTPTHLNRQSDTAFAIQKLEVRQHPVLGTFVHGLTEAAAGSCEEVLDLIKYGTTIRTVGATAMNQNSSRSHCIFTFKTTVSSCGHSKLSQTHLVDLAGSERSKRSGATGERLKEGAAINKTLSTLARVISALAEEHAIAPFRDSKLTYILKESLCGNSKTVMIAAISPSLADYDETLSTLRFAQSVKKVQTHAVLNETNEGDIEQSLKREVHRLKEQLELYKLQKDIDQQHLQEANAQLEEQEELCQRYGDWDNALAVERGFQVQRRVLTNDVDLDYVREQFQEISRKNLDRRRASTERRRLLREGVESATDEEDELYNETESESHTDESESEPATDRDAPVLVQIPSEASPDASSRRLSAVEINRLRQGALVATPDTAEELAETLRPLKVDATEAESLTNRLTPPGAPSVRLLTMVAVDPSESRDSHQTTALVAVVPCSSGSFQKLDSNCSAEGEASEEASEWLSAAELQIRLAWLRRASEDLEQQSRIGSEGAWAACRRAVQGTPGLDDELTKLRTRVLDDELTRLQLRRQSEHEDSAREVADLRRQLKGASGLDDELTKLRTELARVRLGQQDEQERSEREAADLRRQLKESIADLNTARGQLLFSDQSRRELVLADSARREMESIRSPRPAFTFEPMELVQAPQGDVAAEIAASFRNALGALDQAQAALKGNHSPLKSGRQNPPTTLGSERKSSVDTVRSSVDNACSAVTDACSAVTDARRCRSMRSSVDTMRSSDTCHL